MRLLAAAAFLFLCGCPPPTRPCVDNAECDTGDVCVFVEGEGSCKPAGLAPDPVDVPETDAGVRDDGLALRGTIDVAAGELRGGTKVLRGRILAPGPTTAVGGTLRLDADLYGAVP